ncbi:hypothetical protein GIW81_00505 [Hyphomicrobium sp. xq]|uniref:Uncharacterized protein n=1 Tax=Hyphomicrobium album TaxID=2665159 RepID=A0A6I3KJ54_9HYPH|nr:hypothetical protein [Hyphomicrobium album]MTD92811.1 hypothetical protein [Hyphomicrobium album]
MTGMRSLFVLAMLSTQGAIAAENEPPQVTPALRQRAEDLAGAASRRFSDILDGGQRVEIAQGARSQAASGDQAPATGTFAPVWNWLYRAQKSYDDVVIAQLKNPNGWTVIVQKAGEPASPPKSEPAPEVEPAPQLKGWSGLVEMVRDWLARANRSYRNEIVTPLREPGAAEVPSELAKQPSSAAEPGDEIKRGAEEEAQARSRSLAAKRAAEEDDAKRRAEATGQAKQQGDAAAAKRAAAEAEAKRRDVEQAAVAARRAEDEKRRMAAAEAERKAVAEFRARQIEAAAEARRKADDDARAAREAKAKRVAEEETKRREAEAKRQAAEADAAERKAVAEAEAESKRKAEIEAEATRRSQEAAKAKETERTKRAEQAKEPARADVTAVQPAPSPAAPAPDAKPSRPSGAPASAPPATPPPPVAKESSTVAAGTATAGKDEKPIAPKPEPEASPKAREESVIAEAPPPVAKKKSLKRSATTWRSGKKQAYAYGRKKHRAYNHRQPRRANTHVGKRRWASSEPVHVERRCACRCGGILSRPRKHKRVIWGGYAPPRVHGYKHRGGRLTHRQRRHYIDE